MGLTCATTHLGSLSFVFRGSSARKQSNHGLEVTSWVPHQAIRCRVIKVYFVLMVPEGYGGHCVSGPASPWDLPEFGSLQEVSDAVRGAAFSCRLANAEKKHPVGILTNLPLLREDLDLSWAGVARIGGVFAHQGPLPHDCQCSQPDLPKFGVSGFFLIHVVVAFFRLPLEYVFDVLPIWTLALFPWSPGSRTFTYHSPTGSALLVCSTYWLLREATGSISHAVHGLVFLSSVSGSAQRLRRRWLGGPLSLVSFKVCASGKMSPLGAGFFFGVTVAAVGLSFFGFVTFAYSLGYAFALSQSFAKARALFEREGWRSGWPCRVAWFRSRRRM